MIFFSFKLSGVLIKAEPSWVIFWPKSSSLLSMFLRMSSVKFSTVVLPA